MGIAMVAMMAHAAFIQSLFTLEVEPRITMEGGPIVIDVTATYHGPQPLLFSSFEFADFPLFSITAPPSWRAIPRQPKLRLFYFGSLTFESLITYGGKIQRTLCFHRSFAAIIPAGPAVLTIGFGTACSLPGRKGFVVDLQKTVKIDVEPFTQKFADELHRQFVDKRPPFAKTDRPCDTCVELLLDTAHPEFVPLALALLKQHPTFEAELRDHIFALASDPATVHREFVEDILSGNPQYDVVHTTRDWCRRERPPLAVLECSLFYLNYARKNLYGEDGRRPLMVPYHLTTAKHCLGWLFQRLPDPLLKKLQREGNLWIKTMVCVTFPNRVTPEWREGVCRDLKERVSALPETLLDRWLGKLDADDYRERAAATRFFLNHFDRTQPFLTKAKTRPLSAEASDRLTTILERGKQLERDPSEREIMQLLNTTTEGTPFIRILAAGNADCLVTQEAKAFLKERAK